jgi:hypothetical protein
MSPLQVAAQFAAFAWYTSIREARSQAARDEGLKFARANWRAFLPVASEGMGRLLLRVASSRKPHRIKSAKGRASQGELAAMNEVAI